MTADEDSVDDVLSTSSLECSPDVQRALGGLTHQDEYHVFMCWTEFERGAWIADALGYQREHALSDSLWNELWLCIERDFPNILLLAALWGCSDSSPEVNLKLKEWYLRKGRIDGLEMLSMDARRIAMQAVECESATIKSNPSRTVLVRHRLGSLRVSHEFSHELMTGAVRRSVDASSESNECDARAKSLQAALEMTQAIEYTLTRRLYAFRRDFVEEAKQLAESLHIEKKKGWVRRIVPTKKMKVLDFGRRRLQDALECRRYPSLAVMGGWLRTDWRIEPSSVADKIQGILGIPSGLEEDVYIAGETRNILAHRPDYEGPIGRNIGPADALVRREMFDGFERLYVPEYSLEVLEWIARCVMQREFRNKP